ncbi:cell wall assembly protein Knr4 [Streptomyces sp. SAT1]|uniref:SMI1/KNR4 family protein n=1 Tax=Streptomyces sp. SAT1 TaxID=1849967 RepID=UPI0007DDB19A|nr:SMI1/KNR4 family protein [Streptomyces sp. SAT1]ANH89712.1 cell wall assembly protein Knr4 [Streptomyces sp. SAT1]
MTRTHLPAFEREWSRFASWLRSNSPADHAMLRGPAERERLAELESRLGFDLHPELNTLLQQHDGAAEPVTGPGSRRSLPAGAFLPSGHRLSSVDDILMMYDVLVEVGRDNIDADLWADDALAVNLHRCVPFALPNDGGVAFIDHRPGPSYGHVYEMGIGSGDLDGTLWATGLTQLFRTLADALESGGPFLCYWPTLYEAEPGHHCLEWHIRT